MTSKRPLVLTLALAALLASALLIAPAQAGSSSRTGCAKFNGTVLLTYSNPQTIILHIIRGKVNAPTTFTMTATTSYLRNGVAASFADIKIGDTGTITATAQLPSGTLLACTVTMSGP
jgi:hypothetical protein